MGTTYPNPLVGSVIVGADGVILGEGFHHQAGKPHAEVNAIADAEQRGVTNFSKAIIYVNLEPCSHHGKTPPCALLLIEKGFKQVVIGTLDPHEKVAGKGVRLLEQAGIKVDVGFLETECNELNKRFFTFHKKQRPYIILKWAQSADGFLAPLSKNENKPVWITGTETRQYVHKTRAQEQAILVGGKTVIDDDPSLTVRDWHGKQPVRVVLDSKNDLIKTYKIFDEQADTKVLHRPSNEIQSILKDLYDLQIQSVIVEGGLKTLQSFLNADAWDEIHQYIGTVVYLKDGLPAPHIPALAELKNRLIIQNDVLKTYIKA
ncbi:diaminohydroxyphosphoribosylaminopyrimidine deaminase [Nonlabens marinus S1-08]|uniref:Riboflavin biosynthesis protein RibD n=1 Tax=Nonlabens marinus S1-08 TaxID=1454201 RepID=W8VRW9_9FLAO|nr:diaminohydroxyphosphoribosylaminopyrimidine deaminase [Nonlabens marinus S1-08]